MYGPDITDESVNKYVIGADMHNSNNWNRFLEYPGIHIYGGDALSKNDFRPDCAKRNIDILQKIGNKYCIQGDHDDPKLYGIDNLSDFETKGYRWAKEQYEKYKKIESKEGLRIKRSAKEIIYDYEKKVTRNILYAELPEKYREFLSRLPKSISFPLDGAKATVIHDKYHSNKKYRDLHKSHDSEEDDILGIRQVIRAMEKNHTGVAFRGHSHTPYLSYEDESGKIKVIPVNKTTEEISIDKDRNTVIGTGALSRIQKLDVSGGDARTYYTKKHEISFAILRFYKDTHDLTAQIIVEDLIT